MVELQLATLDRENSLEHSAQVDRVGSVRFQYGSMYGSAERWAPRVLDTLVPEYGCFGVMLISQWLNRAQDEFRSENSGGRNAGEL